MSREVRMVPRAWQHPRDATGNYIPMEQDFSYTLEEIEEGLHEGWLKNEPPLYGVSVMPNWPESERTHYMMYEATTEGTPISPAFATPEELARWLADNKASAFANHTASYEWWLAVIMDGSTVGSCEITIRSGQK